MAWMDRVRAACGMVRPLEASAAYQPSAVSRIEYDRVAPPAWQAALDAQHVPGTARLVVAWEPGDVWQPIHRWFLWQLQPWAGVPDAVRRELQGPHPRTNARLTYVPRTVNGQSELRPALVGGPCRLIDRRTWELHRAHEAATGERVWPRRLWVIQGPQGGHPFAITGAEQSHRRAAGLPDDVPSAGDLPYAEFDPRVLTALERYDLWRYAQGLGDPVSAAAKATIARLTADERAAHRLLWAKWETLADEWASGAAHAARQDGLHLLRHTPVGASTRPTVDYEAVKARFINDTSMEAA